MEVLESSGVSVGSGLSLVDTQVSGRREWSIVDQSSGLDVARLGKAEPSLYCLDADLFLSSAGIVIVSIW